jgi:hypothetical protein
VREATAEIERFLEDHPDHYAARLIKALQVNG